MTKHFESIRSFADRTRPTIVNGAWDQSSGHLDTRRRVRPCWRASAPNVDLPLVAWNARRAYELIRTLAAEAAGATP